MHGGSSLYELDEEALAAVEPDLILTQELCHVCAVSYREVNEVARRIDADITVVSLEPTSIEGILHTITTVGAMAEVEDAAIDLVEALLRERLGAVEQRVVDAARAGQRPPRVVGLEWLDPPFAVGHWVPEQIRRAGGWDLLGSDGDKAHQTTWDAVAEVDPEMLFLMPCGFHLAETIDEWGGTPKPPLDRGAPAVPRGAVFALDGSAYFSRRAAGHRRDRDAGRDHGPGRVRRHRPARRLDAGRGAEVPFRRDLLLPVVRHGHDDAARRPRGLGAALPGLRRQGRRQRVPAVPAPAGARRAVGRRRGRAPSAATAAGGGAAAAAEAPRRATSTRR